MGVVEILKPHNLEAYQEINRLLGSGVKKIAIPRATGSGKTYVVGALAEQFNDEKKLVLEPTRPLLNSIKEKFDEFGIENTDFITYQKLIRMSDEDIAEMDYKLIFLDEFHHGTAPVWGQKIDYLMKTHSDSIIFGTSATTVRNDGVNVVESLFDNNAVGELPLSTAIARKVLPCPHYITAIYRIDDEFEKLKKRVEDSTNTKDEKKEFYRKMQEMKVHFEKSYGIPLVLNKYIKVRNGKYLVFCKNKKHLDTMRDVVVDWFKTAGIKDIHSYAVYSDYPDKEKDYRDFQDDNSDSAKILFSINMLNEGLHIKDISGVLMLRTTRSNLIYLQQLGRLLEAGNMDKYLLVFDFVNNFSCANGGIGLLREIKDAIAREKESNPDFDDSGFEDIDTYFVIDQILEAQEMFKEIEGRLEGSWDVMFQEYCKFYATFGHGEVPCTEEYRKLNYWCMNQRQNLKNGILKEERRKLLDERGFIWSVFDYKFSKNVLECMKFYETNSRLPNQCSENDEERKLAKIIINYKNCMSNYPQWKQDLLNRIPTLFDNKCRFDKFYEMVLIYKQRYGHVNIKQKDIIDGYKIGYAYDSLIQYFNNGGLTDKQVENLKKINIDITKGKLEKQYYKKMQLAQQALSEGAVISFQNQLYKGVNLYNWYHTNKNKFTEEELKIMNKLVPNKTNKKTIKMIDVNSGQTYIFPSISAAGKALYDEFHIVENDRMGKTIITKRLTGETKNPIYKERYKFEYAENKVS